MLYWQMNTLNTKINTLNCANNHNHVEYQIILHKLYSYMSIHSILSSGFNSGSMSLLVHISSSLL